MLGGGLMELSENYLKLLDKISIENGFTAEEVERIQDELIEVAGADSTYHLEDSEHLVDAFSWNSTPQGHTYWWTIEDRILGKITTRTREINNA